MQTLALSSRTLLAVAAVSLVACSASDAIVGSSPSSSLHAPDSAQVGMDRLKQDIAWVRSLPNDIRIGAAGGAEITRDEFAADLTKVLQRWPRTASAGSKTLVPSPSANYFGSTGDVGGGTALMFLYTDANGFRHLKNWAYTQCNQGSMVVAKIELHADWYDWATGAPIGPWLDISSSRSAPNYVSHDAEAAWGGKTVRVQAQNKHTCQFGTPDDYPHTFTGGMLVV